MAWGPFYVYTAQVSDRSDHVSDLREQCSRTVGIYRKRSVTNPRTEAVAVDIDKTTVDITVVIKFPRENTVDV